MTAKDELTETIERARQELTDALQMVSQGNYASAKSRINNAKYIAGDAEAMAVKITITTTGFKTR